MVSSASGAFATSSSVATVTLAGFTTTAEASMVQGMSLPSTVRTIPAVSPAFTARLPLFRLTPS